MTTEIIEFPLTEEIKELGISRVYTGIRDNTDEHLLLIECIGLASNPLQCTYDRASSKKTAKELELVLHTHTIKRIQIFHNNKKKYSGLLFYLSRKNKKAYHQK